MKEATSRALNRLAKWRVMLTGWHMGTRAKGDPAGDSYRDLMEFRLMIRVEVSAITRILVDKGLMTEAEFEDAVVVDAALLDEALASQFPGVRSNDEGLVMNPAEINRAGWMRNWLP